MNTETENLGTCKCGQPGADEPHECPYAREVGRDYSEDHCTCCDKCVGNCAGDV